MRAIGPTFPAARHATGVVLAAALAVGTAAAGELPSAGPQPPSAAVVFLLDKSSSMSAKIGEQTRLAIVKDALIVAVATLDPGAEIGVIFYDSAGHPAYAGESVTLLPLPDPETLTAAVAPVFAGGSSDLFPGLVLALQAVQLSTAPIRHVIVFSDGAIRAFPDVVWQQVARQFFNVGASVSVVAIPGSDAAVLETLAAAAGGAYTETDEALSNLADLMITDLAAYAPPPRTDA